MPDQSWTPLYLSLVGLNRTVTCISSFTGNAPHLKGFGLRAACEGPISDQLRILSAQPICRSKANKSAMQT